MIIAVDSKYVLVVNGYRVGAFDTYSEALDLWVELTDGHSLAA